jgi:Zn-finger nucleic acid-binding protein
MRKCDNCGAALDVPTGTVVCKFCQAVNAPPAAEVKVPVPVQVIQQVVQVTGDPTDPGRLCPHCRKRLASVRVLEVELAGCGGCGGIWIDNEGAQRILASPDQVFAELASRAAKNKTSAAPPRTAAPQCPVCKVGLDRVKTHELELDVCRDHGTWFDAWELKRLVMSLRGVPEAPHKAPEGQVHCASCQKLMPTSAANVSDRGPLCDACWRTEQDELYRRSLEQERAGAGVATAVGGALLAGVLAAVLAGDDRRST